MKYFETEYPVMYHGTSVSSIPGILKERALMPAIELARVRAREQSWIAEKAKDFSSFKKFIALPGVDRFTLPGGKKTLKKVFEESGLTITPDNFTEMIPTLIDLEIEERVRDLKESEEKERWENVWISHNLRLAHGYSSDGVTFGIAIPQNIEVQARYRWPGQIGFPCRIPLSDNLKEIWYRGENSSYEEHLKETFKEYNPQIRSL